MKNIFNKIFMFILGGIIFSSITIFAYTYRASDISYKDSNVEDSLNELSLKLGKPVTGTSHMNGYQVNTKVSLGFRPSYIYAYTMSSGKFIVVFIYNKENNENYTLARGCCGVSKSSSRLNILDDGFTWESSDSSWGDQIITYYAFR